MPTSSKSTLPHGSLFVPLVVALNVVILFFVLLLLSSGTHFTRGYTIQMPSSPLQVAATDESVVITVTAGFPPALYWDDTVVENGMAGLPAKLADLNRQNNFAPDKRRGVILQLDAKVTRAIEQEIINNVLLYKIPCTIVAEPNIQ